MNELIKKLAKKSGMNFTPAQFSGVLEDEVDEFKMQKFAQLIVQECADVAYNFGEPFEDGPGTKISDKIQEHFGVE